MQCHLEGRQPAVRARFLCVGGMPRLERGDFRFQVAHRLDGGGFGEAGGDFAREHFVRFNALPRG